MKKIKIYIVGYEAEPIEGGVSGFSWHPEKEGADKEYENLSKINEPHNTEVYRGEIEIEVSPNYSATEEEKHEITLKVEKFLEKNGWEKSFI